MNLGELLVRGLKDLEEMHEERQTWMQLVEDKEELYGHQIAATLLHMSNRKRRNLDTPII